MIDLSLNDKSGAWLHYHPGWMDTVAAADAFRRLTAELDWRREVITVYGRKVVTPRQTAWYGDAGVCYRYSGTDHIAEGWHPLLLALKTRLAAEFDKPVNSVLGNFYRDGHDYMGWHSDNERELGAEPVIFSLSLGAARFFDYRLKSQPRARRRIELEAGSLLVMGGTFQALWQHRAPKQLCVKDGRINLTFRRIERQPEDVSAETSR